MNLDASAVYEKSFTVGHEGYGCREVDLFLDAVIEDYETYDENIDRLEAALQRFKRKAVELEEQINNLSDINEELKRSML